MKIQFSFIFLRRIFVVSFKEKKKVIDNACQKMKTAKRKKNIKMKCLSDIPTSSRLVDYSLFGIGGKGQLQNYNRQVKGFENTGMRRHISGEV